MMLDHPDFDIILSDINMPEMDGLTLLTKINEMRNPALKCIIVSAYGDMENIRTAMNHGAFDFATKPIDMEDLERTIEKAVEQISFIKEAQKEHHQLEEIQYDLNVAREIQQSILPKQFPPFPQYKQFDLYATMSAAKAVGGDFYDFFLVDDNHLGFTIADVSDKGIPAAIFMAISRTVIRATALRQLSPAVCMKESNDLLCRESVNGMFGGNSTELKNAVLFNKVQVPHYNYVGDAVLGYKSHMGAGSICSNVKSDKKLVVVKDGDEKIETGLKKFGAMLGDHVEVGCGSVLNPGTVIGRNSNIYPLSPVRGCVPADSIYKNVKEIVKKK